MAKQSQVKARRKMLNPIFHLQSKTEDDEKLSIALLKHARKSGQLNLSSRSLQTIPERLWSLYEPGGEETSVNYDLCKNDDQPWWNYQPLQNLDLSSNVLTEIDPRIEIFQELMVLNLQDNNLTSLPNEINQLTKLTKLNISHNKLTVIPDCVYKLTELRTLLMSHNIIDTVTTDLGDLVMLQHLDLSHNSLTNLPSGTGYLVRLTQANFSHNKLIELPPDIVNLRGNTHFMKPKYDTLRYRFLSVLIKLDLTQNELVFLPPLGELRKLQILYATHNNIEAIPNCEGCESLQELHFGNNYIKEITPEFCESLPHLKILDLRDNKIEDLPKDISHLQQLIRLDVTNNSLTNLPNTLGFLAHLQSLQVDGNKIRSIRRDIIQCGTTRILKFLRERLQVENAENVPLEERTDKSPQKFPDRFAIRNARGLILAMQDLTIVPDDVFLEAKKVEIHNVDLCRNKFQEVPSGLKLLSENVTEINLSVNLLATVPDFISLFNRLQYLNLSNNHLKDLPASFGDLKYLRELVISNNKFTTIPFCVYNMEGLEILLARDNQIHVIDIPNLSKLKRLATLDLTNNNLDHIPPEMGNMNQLRSLEITGNSFRSPRYAVLAKGTDAILAYLRDRIPT